jgi:mono/diheme cytochrome c family protein
MSRRILVLAGVLAYALYACAQKTEPPPAQQAAAPVQSPVERGKYLVTFGGCNDCHTPMAFGPQGPHPDMSRMLSGHPQDANLPSPPLQPGPWWLLSTLTAFAGPWGISYASNITPDTLTGIGIWTEDIFVRAMRTGRHAGVSRPILPPMPWQSVATLTDEDISAVYAYLRTVPPIHNQVPEPFIVPQPGSADSTQH